MYKQLDNYEKLKYFNSNTLIKLIGNSPRLKTFVTIYILTPLIKINYVIISTLIYLLYALCENEMDNILLKNGVGNVYSENMISDNSTNSNNGETPIINFIKIGDTNLKILNDELVNTNNSPTVLKNDVDLFMSMINLNDNNNNDNNDKDKNTFSINPSTNIAESIDLVGDYQELKDEMVPNQNGCVEPEIEKLSEYLIDGKAEDVKEDIKEDVKEDIKEDIKEYITENKEEIPHVNPIDIEEPVEILTIDEIDFGDYMSNLIKKSENVPIVNDGKKPNGGIEKESEEELGEKSSIPVKIKIGKKKK
jgi:hypothetical protein